jgi:hypothetical protein
LTKDTNPKDALGVQRVPLMSVIPQNVIAEVALALLEGAWKYGRHNYRAAGVRPSVYVDAAQGHIGNYWEGEDIDPDSERHHVIKAIAGLVVLYDSICQENVQDDRPPKSKVLPRDARMNAKAKALLDKMATTHGPSKAPFTAKKKSEAA